MEGHAIGSSTSFQSGRPALAKRFYVGSDLETGHLLLQWQKFVFAHHHYAKQVGASLSRRENPLLFKVNKQKS